MILTETERSVLQALTEKPNLCSEELVRQIWPEQEAVQVSLRGALSKVLRSMQSRGLLTEAQDRSFVVSTAGRDATLIGSARGGRVDTPIMIQGRYTPEVQLM